MNNSSETGLLCPVNIHTISFSRVNCYNYANKDFQYPKVVKYAFTIFIITKLISQQTAILNYMYILRVNRPITLCQNFTYLLTRLEKSKPNDLGLLQKGLIGYTDGSRTWGRTGAEV
jgi:hypothetical protein